MKILKVFNDPVYGFVQIKSPLALKIIEHPYFQRMRRIKQLGLGDLVYPGANHTRFQHALGAMHLAGLALDMLKNKGHEISDEEYEATQLALLLHDIGHGPFSHTLENSLLQEVHHESVSYQIMLYFNTLFGGALDLCLKIFRNSYHRMFFNQLVNSQLDMDRLDYLKRDSYFTGVPEGHINSDRIIQLLNIKDDRLVVEDKGIYTLENFLNARRLMYWQVYLHKTSLSAEQLLNNIIKRAKDLLNGNEILQGTESLLYFLNHQRSLEDFSKPDTLEQFARLDDSDVWAGIKLWQKHPDKILSTLCKMILNRDLFKIQISSDPIQKEELTKIKSKVVTKYSVLKANSAYFFSHGSLTNEAYIAGGKAINLINPSREIIELAHAADLPNIKAMSKIVRKYYLCYPKNLYL
ncbi:MAG: HD domain-containing protein [Cyclobacteriaceae bacterium]|nr:HD domain-containing protein [Cyclobacteriaceae bacterium]